MGTVVEDIVAPNIPRIVREYFHCEIIEDFSVRRKLLNTSDCKTTREFDVIAAGDRAPGLSRDTGLSNEHECNPYAEVINMHAPLQCAVCGAAISHGYEAVNISDGTGSPGRLLCNACANREAAEHAGISFYHPRFDPVTFPDARGREHTFDFATRLHEDRVSIEAYEHDDELTGYQFSVLGPYDKVPKLYQRLLGRMRRALTREHLVEKRGRLSVGDELTLRGRFTWDEETGGRLPLLVIDGKPVDWEELGKLLMCFEGWQFRLEMVDPSDEV